MSNDLATGPLDFETRLRRSRGRTGRVVSLTVKLTREERERLESLAVSKKQAAGEWAREQLLAVAARPPKEDILLTELIGLRMIVVNLLKPIAVGEDYTEDQFRALMDHVRNDKHRITDEIVSSYVETQKKR